MHVKKGKTIYEQEKELQHPVTGWNLVHSEAYKLLYSDPFYRFLTAKEMYSFISYNLYRLAVLYRNKYKNLTNLEYFKLIKPIHLKKIRRWYGTCDHSEAFCLKVAHLYQPKLYRQILKKVIKENASWSKDFFYIWEFDWDNNRPQAWLDESHSRHRFNWIS